MPAPSLLSSCIAFAMKNVRGNASQFHFWIDSNDSQEIYSIGALEYMQIEPVLRRVESTDQLHQIEEASPQIKGDDKELWQRFIARDFPRWREKNYAPKNPTKWYEVYCKYQKEQREEIARDEAILRETMLGLKKKREENVSQIVDLRKLPKVPKDPRMLANNGGVPLGKSRGSGGKITPSSLSWNAGSKTKMTDGRSVLVRARREAKEISQMSKLSKPSHSLAGRAGQVQRAPAGMAQEYKIAAQPKAIKFLHSKRASNLAKSGISGNSQARSDLEEREERLRRAMQPKTSTMVGSKRSADGDLKQTVVEFSDDDSDNAIEDLFGEEEASFSQPAVERPKRPVPKSATSPTTSQPRPQPTSISKSVPPSRNTKPTLPHERPRSTFAPKSKDNAASLASSSSNSVTASYPSAATTVSSPAVWAISPSSANGQMLRQGPPPGGMKPQMLPRKKKEVDVFNRRPSKKPRMA